MTHFLIYHVRCFWPPLQPEHADFDVTQTWYVPARCLLAEEGELPTWEAHVVRLL